MPRVVSASRLPRSLCAFGSSTFGQSSLRCLLGKVGSQDVRDVADAVKDALARGFGDPSRVFYAGGSHAGFVGAHLASRPELLTAASAGSPSPGPSNSAPPCPILPSFLERASGAGGAPVRVYRSLVVRSAVRLERR